jgi:hypothetical protein
MNQDSCSRPRRHMGTALDGKQFIDADEQNL